MNYLIIVILVLLSALFSGLTLGLFSLNKTDLERKIKLGDKEAKKVYSVRKDGNFLLTTLLLGNVGVNSVLSIFLESIAGGVLAAIVATALIVIFGEIIPQATFSRYALKFGSKTTWLVKFFMVILFPVAKPLALGLDLALGKEMPIVWSREELKKIVEFHEDIEESDLDADEERILLGALSFSNKMARDIMTPRTVVFTIDESEKLTEGLIRKIKESGFDRVIVKKGAVDNIVGLLYARDLIGVPVNTPISEVFSKDIFVIKGDRKLDSLLNEFLSQRNHLALVFDEYGGFQGVITLEDIIEEILNVEIIDENDKIADLRALARKKAQRYINQAKRQEGEG